MEQANNVMLEVAPRKGKTHLVTALAVSAMEHHHRRVRFFSTVELVNARELKKATGKAGQIAHRPMYVDMVILDELGYLPFSASGTPGQRPTAHGSLRGDTEAARSPQSNWGRPLGTGTACCRC